MNETLRIIKDRYSCRDFTEKAPSQDQLEEIIDAALHAPSALNRQQWQVIVIKNKDILAEMEEEGLRVMKEKDDSLYQLLQSRNGTIFYHAPCMVLIAIKPAEQIGEELIDLGIVAQNIVIAASSLDLASCHLGLARFCFLGGKAQRFKEKLSFNEGYEFGLAVLLGEAKAKKNPHSIDPSKVTIVE